jgi:CDP-diacylglycerol--glycerol-3-phosphate 3-phosphatidyltransferase
VSRSVLSREEYLDRWSTLHGGYDPRTNRFVGPWLTLVHACATPFAKLGVPPDVVTLLGGLLSVIVVWVCTLGDRWLIAAAVLVGLTGLTDSLDGAVAVMTGRESRWGAVLDSVVDRISDVLYLVALAVVGAPLWACVVAGVLLFTQEYARARAAAIGLEDIGVLTVGERPTRVTVVAMFLLAAGIYPSSAAWWASAGVYVSVAVGAVALVQLLVVVRRRLR